MDDAPQLALGELAVVRHCQPAVRGFVVTQDDMTAGLAVDLVAKPPQGSNRFPAETTGSLLRP